jgi:hypothetical protein
VKCPGCGYQNKPDVDTCNLCGAVLRRTVKKGGTVEMQIAAELRPKHTLESVGTPPIELAPGVELTIGRQPGSGLTIPSNRVSRLHAIIRWEGDKPFLVDKGSSNGTFVSGKRVKDHPLKDGDELEIGPYLCIYRHRDPLAAKADEPRKADPLAGSGSDLGERTSTIGGRGDLFSGTLKDGGLAEVLQGLEFNTKTGTLDVFGKEGEGWITVTAGVPMAANANGKEDAEAIFSLLAMKTGRFTFSPEVHVKDHRMRVTFTALLLEWGRRADELAKTDEMSRTDETEPLSPPSSEPPTTGE